MAGVFDYKYFNAEVFQKYMDRVPNTRLNMLVQSRAIVARPELAAAMSDQVGGNYLSTPLRGLIDGAPLNYDGATNITAGSTKTYMHSRVVVGRAKAWEELDFSYDITGGVDFMENVAQQLAQYWQTVDQDTIVAILTGIFNMTGANNLKFVNGHTADIVNVTNKDNEVGMFDATTLNSAIQKASGDHKSNFSLFIAHSQVATNLENKNLLTYLKQNDANGMQRDTGLATLNGKLVMIDDSMPVAVGYVEATSSTPGALKVVASGATTGQVNIGTVTGSDFYPSGVAADDYVVEQTRYTSFVLGNGAIEYTDCGAMVPYEMDRDPAAYGGKNLLYTRQRKCFAPYGISFTKSSMSTASPTDANLANGANWELVSTSGSGSAKQYIDHKAIPIARIISLG